MKFARYLDDAQTPEWKKAYIDYRGLKKRITAVRRAQEGQLALEAATATAAQARAAGDDKTNANPGVTDADARSSLSMPASASAASEREARVLGDGAGQFRGARTPSPPFGLYGLAGREGEGEGDRGRDYDRDPSPLRSSGVASSGSADGRPALVGGGRRRGGSVTFPASPVLHVVPSPASTPAPGPTSPTSPLTPPSTVPPEAPTSGTASANAAPTGLFAHMRRRSSTIRTRTASLHTTFTAPGTLPPPSLSALLAPMPPVQRAFFDALDRELEKIEGFYLAREAEARERCAALRGQLGELQDHRRVFHEAHPADQRPWSIAALAAHAGRPHSQARWRASRKNTPAQSRAPSRSRAGDAGDSGDGAGTGAGAGTSSSREKTPEREGDAEKVSEFLGGFGLFGAGGLGLGHANANATGNGNGNGVARGKETRLNPEDYTHAKKRLKKAVLEYYRGLEVLNNYRILNLTGFRKALKKFEKTTKIPVQQAYMKEKVDHSAFASGEIVQGLVREMEDQFAARFTRGDKKKALIRLRAASQHKTHHFSTFRTGIALGLAVPALVDGIYRSFQPETRAAIPWQTMLFNYAVLCVPAFFSFLVGLNVLVWSRSRINYVFIFEFDIRTRLDHREYFEIPAIAIATLCYAFWLTFARVGAESVAPTTWPLVWLLFMAGLLINPLPMMFRESRWWLLRNFARLLTSGVHRVEFADFWMGDQFCSLVFTLSNLYFFSCSYIVGFDRDPWRRCAIPHGWGIQFALASLPLLARLVQSVRRWVDSRLVTHLINGGKYGAGIVYYLVYFIWRENGAGRGPSFALFCLFGTIYSTYASSWDFLMDWSVLRPHAKYPLLRSELVYSSYIPLYYFAIVSNVLVRFIWVIYIPSHGRNFSVRTFVAALLEVLRRWQWNFYRLENEHLGNMDQYRVTREVPLPYSFDDVGHESDGGDEDGDVNAKRTRE